MLMTPRRSSSKPPVKAVLLSAGAVVVIGAAVLAATVSGTSGGSATGSSASPSAAAFPEVNLPFDTGSPGGKGTVNVTIEPGLIGRNSVQAVVLDEQGGIATVPEVRMTLTLPGKSIGPLDAKLKNKGGYFGSDTLNLPFPGTWKMAVTVRTSDTDQATATTNVTISRSRPVS
jgi:copper transport protein